MDGVPSSRVPRDTARQADEWEGSSDTSSITKEIPGLGVSANCNFGVGADVNMCKWSNLNMSAFNWLSSKGVDSYWIGGPKMDENEKNKQGNKQWWRLVVNYYLIHIWA